MKAAKLDIAGLGWGSGQKPGLQVDAGAAISVLGGAQSGKSTLIRLLAGDCRDQSRHITYGGRDLATVAPYRRGFGVVFQDDALLGHLTLADNIALPLRLRRLPRRRRQGLVDLAIDLTGLGRHQTLYPSAVDDAIRQRAWLARAIVHEPGLLLLDEPFSHQDAQARASLHAVLGHVRRWLGASVVFATRNPDEAMADADQVAILHEGQMVYHGPPADLAERPPSLHIARLSGHGNELPCTLLQAEDDVGIARLASGSTVQGWLADPELAPGTSCILHVRPERIAIVAGAAPAMGEQAIAATLVGVARSGDRLRLATLIQPGIEIVVLRPAAAGLGRLEIGQPAAIAWQPQHATIFAKAPKSARHAA